MRLQIADCRLQIGCQIGVALVVARSARPCCAPRRSIACWRSSAGQLITLSDVTAARDLGLQSRGRRRRSGARRADQADRSRAGARRSRSLRAARADRRRPWTARSQRVRRAVRVARPPSTPRSRARGSTRSTCAKRCARICGCARISISASAPPPERRHGADRRVDGRPAPPRRRRRSVPGRSADGRLTPTLPRRRGTARSAAGRSRRG